MQKKSGELSPFQERVNVSLFFSGAHRRKILEEIKKDVVDGAPVIIVTGDEGSGKTMVCRMVEKELSGNISCVYLPSTLESFDDVVRILSLGLGTENSKNPGSTIDLVDEITLHLKDSGLRLVAIFDQSERMYLATLERIRKLLDQINNKDVLFQIILVGRNILLENLKQLEICDFRKVEQRHFRLGALGLSETYAYLNHCVQQRTPTRGKNVFSPEAAKKIYTMAQGNFRMTNMLAEKSLESLDSETSFMVLLENVHDGDIVPAAGSSKSRKVSTGGGRKWLLGAVGLSILVAALFYFPFWKKENEVNIADHKNNVEEVIVSAEKEVANSTTNQVESQKKSSEIGKKETTNENDKHVKLEKSTSGVKTVEKRQTQANRIDTGSKTKEVELAQQAVHVITTSQKAEQPIEVVEKTDSKIKDSNISTEHAVAVDNKNQIVQSEIDPQVKSQRHDYKEEKIVTVEENIPKKQQIVVPPLVSVSTNADENYTDLQISQAIEQKEKSSKEENVTDVLDEDVIILFENNKRIPAGQKLEAEGKKIIKIAPVMVKPPESALADASNNQDESATIDQIYQRRVNAASTWLSGTRDDKHTVQLMMLTSEQAEGNLKKRFEQEEYRKIADKLYIIKNTDASIVYVYYGEYSDPDSARNVRNTLPVFLRKHNPYAISVKDAVKKATSP